MNRSRGLRCEYQLMTKDLLQNLLSSINLELTSNQLDLSYARHATHMLEELNKILGLSIPPKCVPPRPGDVRRTLADPSKAKRLLGWKGSVPFTEGLRRTAEWFRAHPPVAK